MNAPAENAVKPLRAGAARNGSVENAGRFLSSQSQGEIMLKEEQRQE